MWLEMAQFSTSPGSGHHQSDFFGQNGNKTLAAGSECESGVGDVGSMHGNATDPVSGDGPNGGGTLSVNFNNPLVGAQRIEMIQQMIKTHVSPSVLVLYLFISSPFSLFPFSFALFTHRENRFSRLFKRPSNSKSAS